MKKIYHRPVLQKDQSGPNHGQKSAKDYLLYIIIGFLCFFGLVMVFESSNVNAFRDFGDQYYFVKDQLKWILLGLAGMFLASFYDYRKLHKLALPLLIGTIISLLLVFIPGFGIRALGAHRWIGLGPVSIQPAEFAKLTLVICPPTPKHFVIT